MPITLESITVGPTPLRERVVVLGPEKVGKSTLAAGAPNPIFLPMSRERGVDEMNVAKFPPAQTYADVVEMIGILGNGEHDYQTAVIDSSSALEPLIFDQVCIDAASKTIEEAYGGFGKGHSAAGKYWQQLCEGFDWLRDTRGMGIVIIGHVITKQIPDPETDTFASYVWDVKDAASTTLNRWADAILFVNYKRANITKEKAGFGKEIKRGVGTGERKIYTEKRPHHPGGNRYGLAYEMSFPKSGAYQKILSDIALGRQGTKPKEEPAPQPKLATA